MTAASLGVDRPEEATGDGVALAVVAADGVGFDETGGDVVDGIRDMVNVFESVTKPE